jgi:hypothetical protein
VIEKRGAENKEDDSSPMMEPPNGKSLRAAHYIPTAWFFKTELREACGSGKCASGNLDVGREEYLETGTVRAEERFVPQLPGS